MNKDTNAAKIQDILYPSPCSSGADVWYILITSVWYLNLILVIPETGEMVFRMLKYLLEHLSKQIGFFDLLK